MWDGKGIKDTDIEVGGRKGKVGRRRKGRRKRRGYLGVTVVAGSMFSTSHLKPLIKFRSSANTVLNVHQKPSEQILMKMLYASYLCSTSNLCI